MDVISLKSRRNERCTRYNPHINNVNVCLNIDGALAASVLRFCDGKGRFEEAKKKERNGNSNPRFDGTRVVKNVRKGIEVAVQPASH